MTHLGGLLQPTFLTPLSLFCPEHGPGPWHLCTAPPFPSQLSRAAIHPHPAAPGLTPSLALPATALTPTVPPPRPLSVPCHLASYFQCFPVLDSKALMWPPASTTSPPSHWPHSIHNGQCFCLRTFIHAALSTWKALNPVFTRPTSALASNVTSLKRPFLMLEPHLAPHKAGLSFTDMSCFVPVLYSP